MELDQVPFVMADGQSSVHSHYRVGKERAGRLLDGREWNEIPERLRNGE